MRRTRAPFLEAALAAPLAAALAAPLVVACGDGARAEAERLRAELAAARAESERLARALDAERDRAEREADELRAALDAERARRVERELAWFEYNRGLATLAVDDVVPGFPVDPALAPEEPPPAPAAEHEPEPDADDEARELDAARADEIARALRALLRIEDVRGLDLLEAGAVGEGWTGPVVFRLLDDRGRLAGSLSARRLRLEASRAGRTVTLVLEEGSESRGGERVPFRGGVRRIALPFVDPRPWIEAAPELFPPEALDARLDDGLWDVDGVRRRLNRLLREESGGWWRVEHLGGVVGDALAEVHLERHGPDGRVERRVFADRVTIEREGGSITLEMRDGVTIRGDARVPFLGGVERVLVVGSDPAAWEAEALPGIGGRR